MIKVDLNNESFPIESLTITDSFNALRSYHFSIISDHPITLEGILLTDRDDLQHEITIINSIITSMSDGRLIYQLVAIEKSALEFIPSKILSFTNSKVSDMIHSLGLEMSNEKNYSFNANYFSINQAIMTSLVFLASTSTSPGLIDFSRRMVFNLDELYKNEPLETTGAFSRMVITNPYITGSYSDSSNHLPQVLNAKLKGLGKVVNFDESIIERVIENCNKLTKKFSEMQFLVDVNDDIELGSVVTSSLTNENMVIVSRECMQSPSNIVSKYYAI